MMMQKRLKWLIFSGAFLIAIIAVMPESWIRRGYLVTVGRFFQHTEESRLAQFGNKASARLNINDFPEKLDIIALKNEKTIELWGVNSTGNPLFIKSYPILAASGTSGPKLKEGDRQVPEGIYAIESLHPNSHFYLALKIAYPSEDDKQMAIADNRDVKALGSAIMLHGKGGSVGCISIADNAMEEIFFMVSKIGVGNTRILILPYDFRKIALPESTNPSWLSERYERLKTELKSKQRITSDQLLRLRTVQRLNP